MIYEKFLQDNPELCCCSRDILKAFELIKSSLLNNGKILTCGNGGSAADAEHIVGELMKGFLLKRALPECETDKLEQLFPNEGKALSAGLQGALPAIALTGQISLSTAFSNDVRSDMTFAQQVYGYAKKGDILIAISTSGNSKNIINAVKIAKFKGAFSIGLTGMYESALEKLCDVTIKAPAAETYRIQEYHLPIYHVLCALTEQEFFHNY